jgi:phenylpropionate dioxygenase-like ring-hydroxylating dioxygenase large terminal subunit
MSSKAENDLLTQTGPGTPGGDLLRRYWQPVALSKELLADTPMPITVMGEELVLFRDETGQPGLLGLYCPHRCADLSYGRIEGGGLRCLYHGWLFDRQGKCLEQPAEPLGSTYKDKIRHTAYPCREAAGAIFAYMGPGQPPLLPNFHFMSAPAQHVHENKLFHHCNYLQANEGNIDPAHLSYLHGFTDQPSDRQGTYRAGHTAITGDPRPKIEIERTRFGVRIYTQRSADDGKKYLRVTNYVFPNLSFFAGRDQRYGQGGYSVHWHVPINDNSHWRFEFYYHSKATFDKAQMEANIRTEIDENHRSIRHAGNRYRQDRQEMKSRSFAGMGNYFASHDLFAVESPGSIHDRSREHLATTDIAIATARRMMLDAMDDANRGRDAPQDPPMTIHSENENVFNDLIVLSAMIDADQNAKDYCAAITKSSDFHGLKPQS